MDDAEEARAVQALERVIIADPDSGYARARLNSTAFAKPQLLVAAIEEQAELLGIREGDYHWIAARSLLAPLPEQWAQYKDTASGRLYYLKEKTGESRWEHPADDQYRQMYRRVAGETVAARDGWVDPDEYEISVALQKRRKAQEYARMRSEFLADTNNDDGRRRFPPPRRENNKSRYENDHGASFAPPLPPPPSSSRGGASDVSSLPPRPPRDGDNNYRYERPGSSKIRGSDSYASTSRLRDNDDDDDYGDRPSSARSLRREQDYKDRPPASARSRTAPRDDYDRPTSSRSQVRRGIRDSSDDQPTSTWSRRDDHDDGPPPSSTRVLSRHREEGTSSSSEPPPKSSAAAHSSLERPPSARHISRRAALDDDDEGDAVPGKPRRRFRREEGEAEEKVGYAGAREQREKEVRQREEVGALESELSKVRAELADQTAARYDDDRRTDANEVAALAAERDRLRAELADAHADYDRLRDADDAKFEALNDEVRRARDEVRRQGDKDRATIRELKAKARDAEEDLRVEAEAAFAARVEVEVRGREEGLIASQRRESEALALSYDDRCSEMESRLREDAEARAREVLERRVRETTKRFEEDLDRAKREAAQTVEAAEARLEKRFGAERVDLEQKLQMALLAGESLQQECDALQHAHGEFASTSTGEASELRRKVEEVERRTKREVASQASRIADLEREADRDAAAIAELAEKQAKAVLELGEAETIWRREASVKEAAMEDLRCLVDEKAAECVALREREAAARKAEAGLREGKGAALADLERSLDQQKQAAVDEVRDRLRRSHDATLRAELAAQKDQLDRALADRVEADLADQRAVLETQKALAVQESLDTARREARDRRQRFDADLAALRADLEAQASEFEAQRDAALAELQAKRTTERRTAASASEDAAALRAELDELKAAHEGFQTSARLRSTKAEQRAADAAASEAELRVDVGAKQAQLDAAGAALDAATQRAERAEQACLQARRDLDGAKLRLQTDERSRQDDLDALAAEKDLLHTSLAHAKDADQTRRRDLEACRAELATALRNEAAAQQALESQERAALDADALSKREIARLRAEVEEAASRSWRSADETERKWSAERSSLRVEVEALDASASAERSRAAELEAQLSAALRRAEKEKQLWDEASRVLAADHADAVEEARREAELEARGRLGDLERAAKQERAVVAETAGLETVKQAERFAAERADLRAELDDHRARRADLEAQLSATTRRLDKAVVALEERARTHAIALEEAMEDARLEVDAERRAVAALGAKHDATLARLEKQHAADMAKERYKVAELKEQLEDRDAKATDFDHLKVFASQVEDDLAAALEQTDALRRELQTREESATSPEKAPRSFDDDDDDDGGGGGGGGGGAKDRVIVDAAALGAEQSRTEEALARFARERAKRRALHNKLMELQGNIRVLARVRPIVDVERRAGARLAVDFPEGLDGEVAVRNEAGTTLNFEFDSVFRPESTQADVFDAVRPMIQSALDGYRTCIFAYGQSGSGKTHTMEGPAENRGVSFRAFSEILAERVVSRVEGKEAGGRLKLSMVEIYNESLRDLLAPRGSTAAKLEIREAQGRHVVPGLTEVYVESVADVEKIISSGTADRATGSHDLNEHSSRSHLIIRLEMDGGGVMNLVDLAGSERLSKTGATGTGLKEAQAINKSLSALGDVIQALSKPKPGHVPYRNSKLTYLLQDSLSKAAKVLMLVNVSPAETNQSETICSLNFAARCRDVQLGQGTDAKAGTAELDRARRQIKSLQAKVRGLEAQLTPSRS